MERKERLERMNQVAALISQLNDRTSFCQDEEEDQEELEACILELTGMLPKVWGEKIGNRKQCYSTMLSKLFLVYLISEIQNGTLPYTDVLEELADLEAEPWDWFFYDDTGEKIGEALGRIFLRALTYGDFFSYRIERLDFFYLQEWDAGGREDAILEFASEVMDCVTAAFPMLKEQMDMEGMDYEFLYSCLREAVFKDDFEAELLIVESSFLYEVEKAEMEKATPLGHAIKSKAADIFRRFILSGWLNRNWQWSFQDEEGRYYNCYVLTSDVIGDIYNYGVEILDRIHTYNYSVLLQLYELTVMMEEYQKTVLGKGENRQ